MCSQRPLGVIGNASVLQDYCTSKISEKRLAGIRCYSVFSRIKQLIQASRHSLHQEDISPANCRFLALL